MNNFEKNTYVMSQIIETTITLLEVKEFSNISISEITERAQVSRNSFYRNFRDKDDILKTKIGELFKTWIDKFDSDNEVKSKKERDDELMANLFGHLYDNSEFYKLLLERSCFHLLRDFLFEIVGPKEEYSNLEAYISVFIFSGIFGWIEEWVKRGMTESAEDMKVLLQNRSM